MIKIINPFLQNLNRIKDLIYPRHIKCIFCGDEIKDLNDYDACEKCLNTLPFIIKDFCPRCGAQMSKDSVGVCMNCKMHNFDFDYARSVFVYDDKVKHAIHKMKIASAKYIVEPLSYALYYYFKGLNWNVDFITYIPIHQKRLKTRGYNQAKELASHLSNLTNIPLIDCFEKIKNTPNQTSLSGKQRQENLKDAFKLIYKELKDKNILIIDDIFTTGATSNEVSKLIRNKGANKIYVLTVAHTAEHNDL